MVRAECVRQRNEVAIKLGIIFSLSLEQPISAFVRPKSAYLGGSGGSLKFLLESSYFCYLGAHAKI